MLRITIHDLLLREEKKEGKKRGRNCKYDPDSGVRVHEKQKIKTKTTMIIIHLTWKKNIQNIRTNVGYAQYVGIHTKISGGYRRTKKYNT